jgi:hypothetical protein
LGRQIGTLVTITHVNRPPLPHPLLFLRIFIAMIMILPILYIPTNMKRRIKIHRWFKRISRHPGHRPQVIEEVIVSEDTMNSFATEGNPNKIDTEIIA